jgi:hypothetical protein
MNGSVLSPQLLPKSDFGPVFADMNNQTPKHLIDSNEVYNASSAQRPGTWRNRKGLGEAPNASFAGKGNLFGDTTQQMIQPMG